MLRQAILPADFGFPIVNKIKTIVKSAKHVTAPFESLSFSCHSYRDVSVTEISRNELMRV